jgi:diguanylate cyclase (GGDEF)-like protein/PAS domain S-box-containing protein
MLYASLESTRRSSHDYLVPARYELLESIPDAVVVTGRDGEIVFANRNAESLTGYGRAELIGRKVELLVPVRLRREHVQLRRDFYHRGVARLMGETEHDFSLRRKDGTNVAVEISLGPAGNNTMAVVRDVTERHLMEKALEHRALHDPLTDLANRSLFFDRLHQSIYNARRDRSAFALVMLDLDGFKSVNDTYGHAVGDELLRRMSARLRQGMRSTDTAARIGGDEFAWILPRVTGRPAAQRMVRKRLAAVQGGISIDRQKIDIGVSAGIAMYPDDGRDADRLIRHADAAMYATKRRRDHRDR